METGISHLLPYFQTQELIPTFVNSMDLRIMLYTLDAQLALNKVVTESPNKPFGEPEDYFSSRMQKSLFSN